MFLGDNLYWVSAFACGNLVKNANVNVVSGTVYLWSNQLISSLCRALEERGSDVTMKSVATMEALVEYLTTPDTPRKRSRAPASEPDKGIVYTQMLHVLELWGSTLDPLFKPFMSIRADDGVWIRGEELRSFLRRGIQAIMDFSRVPHGWSFGPITDKYDELTKLHKLSLCTIINYARCPGVNCTHVHGGPRSYNKLIFSSASGRRDEVAMRVYARSYATGSHPILPSELENGKKTGSVAVAYVPIDPSMGKIDVHYAQERDERGKRPWEE